MVGKFQCLEKSELSSGWSIEERAGLAYFLEDREFEQNESILEPNQDFRALFFIESGVIIAKDKANCEIELSRGQSFGELSLIGPTQKRLQITACNKTKVWILSYEKWLELQKEVGTIAQKLRHAILLKLSRLVDESPVLPKSFQKN